MEKRGRQMSRKRKTRMLEEDDKQNESILEEVLSISGKNVEVSVEKDGSPPARLKRSANKSKEKIVTQSKKVYAKKLPVTRPSLPPSKQKKPTDREKKVNTVINENKTSTTEKGYPVPNLPGWRRESVVRKSGKSAGKIDIYFYSPEGKKLRSRPDVSAYLYRHKIDIKLEEFDFSKKKSDVLGKKNVIGNSTAQRKKSIIQKEEKVGEAEVGEFDFNKKKTEVLGKKNVIGNSTAQRKKSNIQKVGEAESRNSSKAISAKKSRSEKSSLKVPPSLDSGEKSDNVVIKILESKPKKSRK